MNLVLVIGWQKSRKSREAIEEAIAVDPKSDGGSGRL